MDGEVHELTTRGFLILLTHVNLFDADFDLTESTRIFELASLLRKEDISLFRSGGKLSRKGSEREKRECCLTRSGFLRLLVFTAKHKYDKYTMGKVDVADALNQIIRDVSSGKKGGREVEEGEREGSKGGRERGREAGGGIEGGGRERGREG